MSDDYLWDRSGQPDPDVRRLEELLGRFAHDPSRAKLELSSGSPTPPSGSVVRGFRPAPRRGRAWIVLAAAAAIAVMAVGVRVVRHVSRPGWEVSRIEGAPRVGATPIGESALLRVGEWLATDGASRARIRIGEIGETEVEPNSRVRLVRAHTTDHRLALARGTIHARIWAPPRLFFVETPSAVAVDLGCTYTLSVDDAGAARLRVTSGWVAFDARGRETFVPAGAACTTRPGLGAGTPAFEDASAALLAALERLDFDPSGGSRAGDLTLVLAAARERDALTLWHLLSKLEGEERGRTYDRLAALVPPPDGTTRESILAGDRDALGNWWDELDLGSGSWWRLWKQPAPPG